MGLFFFAPSLLYVAMLRDDIWSMGPHQGFLSEPPASRCLWGGGGGGMPGGCQGWIVENGRRGGCNPLMLMMANLSLFVCYGWLEKEAADIEKNISLLA